MHQEILRQLAGISDKEALRRAIAALCESVCDVRGIRLVADQHGFEYLCFVELDTPELNPSLIEKLGGIIYGDTVAFRIPIDRTQRP